MDHLESFKVQIEAKPWLITNDFNVVKIIGTSLFNNKVMEHSFVCNVFAQGNKEDGGEFVA